MARVCACVRAWWEKNGQSVKQITPWAEKYEREKWQTTKTIMCNYYIVIKVNNKIKCCSIHDYIVDTFIDIFIPRHIQYVAAVTKKKADSKH